MSASEGMVLDHGYSWVIFLASFFNQFISLGIPFSFGVYNVEFLDYFRESKAVTAWVCSINIGVLLGCGPITAWLMARFSGRTVSCVGAVLSTLGTVAMYFSTSVYHLYVSYGLITGFGYCMVYIPSAVLVGQYFQKYRSATTGICSVGGSLAILVLPFLYNYTIDRYTWKGSVFILAALNLQMVVFSALLRLRKHNIFWNIGTGILVIIPVDYLYENGTDKETASMLVTFCGGGGLVGGAAAGILGNHHSCNRLFLYIGVNISAGVSGLLYLVSTDVAYIMGCSAVFGFSMGAIVSLLVVLCADIIGVQKLGQAFGYLMFSNGVGNLAGPPLAGLLFDLSGNYRSSLVLAGVLNVLGGVVMFWIPIQEQFQGRNLPPRKTQDGSVTLHTEELSPLST
ncbi:monocarboxylate transporter 14-like [Liolophura sinensis]|uniref:monocarboxylate transporter 14-like n=1 Tax=Liolophura sinensis TaxID=3198878 RepID=UPI00315907B0